MLLNLRTAREPHLGQLEPAAIPLQFIPMLVRAELTPPRSDLNHN